MQSTYIYDLFALARVYRHREGFSPVRLARYTLALNAMCMDPRQFHGHDLIGTLQHHEPPTDYEFALTTLAACSAQAHVRKRQIRRLLDIANAAQDHNVGGFYIKIINLS
jgi:gastric intrinsic factor